MPLLLPFDGILCWSSSSSTPNILRFLAERVGRVRMAGSVGGGMDICIGTAAPTPAPTAAGGTGKGTGTEEGMGVGVGVVEGEGDADDAGESSGGVMLAGELMGMVMAEAAFISELGASSPPSPSP